MKTEVKRLNEFMGLCPQLIKDVPGLIDYLTDNGFFSAPASTKYHGACPGGLYEHSTNVYLRLKWMTETMMLNWQRPESPFIIGMFHDLCKMDQYQEVVDDPGKMMFGEEEPKDQKIHYEYRKDQILSGHGEKSIVLLSRFMTLTEEEILCIRYHMGAYQQEDWAGFDLAIRKYPTVLMTHTADMYASKVDDK